LVHKEKRISIICSGGKREGTHVPHLFLARMPSRGGTHFQMRESSSMSAGEGKKRCTGQLSCGGLREKHGIRNQGEKGEITNDTKSRRGKKITSFRKKKKGPSRWGALIRKGTATAPKGLTWEQEILQNIFWEGGRKCLPPRKGELQHGKKDEKGCQSSNRRKRISAFQKLSPPLTPKGLANY